jgi:hypothetical protein
MLTIHRIEWFAAVSMMAFFAQASMASAAVAIYTFSGGADGGTPEGSLVADAIGNLYGTTEKGGTGYGTVFELSPPPVGAKPGKRIWKETVLYTFSGGGDGGNPTGNLLFDAAGNLYGAAGDVVFQLSPPAEPGQPWTETTISPPGGIAGISSIYANIPGGLIADAEGAIYGVNDGGTQSPGLVFKLTPPAGGAGPWTETVLFDFTGSDGGKPEGGLLWGPGGVLYGTTSAGPHSWGTVFSLAPSAVSDTTWTKTTLYTFTGTTPDDMNVDGQTPYGSLIADQDGNLYGTTEGGGLGPCHTGCGAAYKLTPPSGGGAGPWTETIIHMFGVPNPASDGRYPVSGLTAGPDGALYGTASSGGNDADGGEDGVVYRLLPPAPGKTKWTERSLFSFNFPNGINPMGGVILLDGVLYGTNSAGGAPAVRADDAGTVFMKAAQ